MTDTFRALCAELVDAWLKGGDIVGAMNRARAALDEADEPAVPQGREPAAVTGRPSDEELLATLDKATAAFPPRHPEAEGLNASEYLLALELRKARAVLGRWGNPAPPPADGEVAELVAWLREQLHVCLQAPWTPGIKHFGRAAELLERQVVVPVPVSERLPEPSTKVLAHYFNDLGRKRTICAIWVPAKSRSGDIGDDDDFTEYDEEDGKFYWPEGWYETIENWDDLGYVKVVEGEVIYWQPLPKWHAHALPLPEVGE